MINRDKKNDFKVTVFDENDSMLECPECGELLDEEISICPACNEELVHCTKCDHLTFKHLYKHNVSMCNECWELRLNNHENL